MMGRHERADKVKALFLLGPGQSFQRRFGIVALVKNEGDVLTPLGQLAITLRQFLGDGLKDGAVVDVAGINLVEQRHMKVGADQKAQTDLTQIDAFLFVMAAGRQGGRIARVNIGEEVRPVINQSAQIELKVLDQTLGELLFDGLNVLLLHAVHVIPEGLAGKLRGAGGEQAGEDGRAVPMSQLRLAGGTGGAVDGRQEQILSDRQTLIAFGELSVDEAHQIQFQGLIIEGRDGAEAEDFYGLKRKQSVGGLQGLKDIVQGTEVSGLDNFGLAVHPLAVADIVVRAAFDDLAREAGHEQLGHTTGGCERSNGYHSWWFCTL